MNIQTSCRLLLTCGGLLFMTACNPAAKENGGQEATTDSLSLSPGEGGFVPLFDGQSLQGWDGDTSLWRAENGHLVGEIKEGRSLENNSFIIWQGGTPADFELIAEFKITARGNSGINYRSDMVDGVAHALKGYQADIDGANNYTGQNYEERKRTTLAYRGQKTLIPAMKEGNLDTYRKKNAWTLAEVSEELGNTDSLKQHIRAGDWNEIRIVAQGNHLQHFVNDVLMSDVTDQDTVNGKSSGYLGMQVHVGPPMKVEYRNIRIKEL